MGCHRFISSHHKFTRCVASSLWGKTASSSQSSALSSQFSVLSSQFPVPSSQPENSGDLILWDRRTFGSLTLLPSLFTLKLARSGSPESGLSRKVNVSPTETASNTKREIQIEIPAAEVTRETDTLIQKYQKLARLPGFRRGHVPASIIRQRFAEDLKSDVVEALVPRYFRKETEKQGLIPVSQPRVTDLHLHE